MYFKGESDPIVNPAKSNTMKRYIEKIEALPDADRNLLTDYILHP